VSLLLRRMFRARTEAAVPATIGTSNIHFFKGFETPKLDAAGVPLKVVIRVQNFFAVHYKQSVMQNAPVQLSTEQDAADIQSSAVRHFVADNLDHNIKTLDGLGTFHGMGIQLPLSLQVILGLQEDFYVDSTSH